MKDFRSFGKRLAESRESKKLSIERCAEQVNVTRERWTGWENGVVPSPDELIAICQMLDVQLTWLLTGRANTENTYHGIERNEFSTRQL